MSMGYSAKVLETFFKDDRGERAESDGTSAGDHRSITLDTAELLEQALDLAMRANLSDHDQIVRRTARLGLRIAPRIARGTRPWTPLKRIWPSSLAAKWRRAGQCPGRRRSRRARRWPGGWPCGRQGGLLAAAQSIPLPPSQGALDAKKDGVTFSDGPLVVDALPPDSGPAARCAVRSPPSRRRARDTVAIDGESPDLANERPLVVDMVPRRSMHVMPERLRDPLPQDAGARDVAATSGMPGATNRPSSLIRSSWARRACSCRTKPRIRAAPLPASTGPIPRR